jgi:hypothetical protein
MRGRTSGWFGGTPVALFSLGVLAGAAWERRRAVAGRARGRRPFRRPAEPPQARSWTAEHAQQPGGERASVLGYERAPTPPPSEPEAPSGAPGHRILNG